MMTTTLCLVLYLCIGAIHFIAGDYEGIVRRGVEEAVAKSADDATRRLFQRYAWPMFVGMLVFVWPGLLGLYLVGRAHKNRPRKDA